MAPTDAATKVARVSVRIPADLARTFAVAAELAGKSRSDATREAVEAYIASVAQQRGEREAGG